MKNKLWKRVLGAMCACFLIGSSFSVRAEEKITPSNVGYTVNLRDANNVFIGNKTAVDWKVGDSYFLTYTVKKLEKDENTQSGVIVTRDRDATYPYKDVGGMIFSQKSLLCEEGYTYFFRYDVTKDGLDYVAGKSNGTDSEYVKFQYEHGTLDEKMPYFGVWMSQGDGVTVELGEVRCYDKNGRDLGVYAPKATNITISEMVAIDVPHSYSFSVEEKDCVAFGAARKTKSDVIFMEYQIQNVKAENVDQSGAIMASNLNTQYPHGNSMGYLKVTGGYKDSSECKLITEGARYLVRFERGEESFDVLVKRTVPSGAVDYFSFTGDFGKYRSTYGYVAMWIGNICSLTADFTDVKCYDDQGKNLGIQTNKGVEVTHYGDLEDYSQCLAVYYCEANDTFITLDDECAASKKKDGEASAQAGSYTIRDSVLKLDVGAGKEEFNYLYDFFTDKDGNKYVRLREWNVTFVSKRMGGETLKTVKVTAENGFKVGIPETPEREGHKFLKWVKNDGTEYDFTKVVTDATTLYALWDGEESWLVSALSKVRDFSTPIVAGACVILIGGTAAGIVLLRKGKKKHANEN